MVCAGNKGKKAGRGKDQEIFAKKGMAGGQEEWREIQRLKGMIKRTEEKE